MKSPALDAQKVTAEKFIFCTRRKLALLSEVLIAYVFVDCLFLEIISSYTLLSASVQKLTFHGEVRPGTKTRSMIIALIYISIIAMIMAIIIIIIKFIIAMQFLQKPKVYGFSNPEKNSSKIM